MSIDVIPVQLRIQNQTATPRERLFQGNIFFEGVVKGAIANKFQELEKGNVSTEHDRLA